MKAQQTTEGNDQIIKNSYVVGRIANAQACGIFPQGHIAAEMQTTSYDRILAS